MKNQVTILSLDLGANLGWARCVGYLRPEVRLDVVDYGVVDLDSLVDVRMKNDHNDVYTRHRVRMIIFEEVMRKLIDMAKFDCFVSEDIFFCPKRVNAYRVLSTYYETLERIINVDLKKPLYAIPPRLIKQCMSGYGDADKTMVQDSILANNTVKLLCDKPLQCHSADAIAGAFSFISSMLALPNNRQ